MQATLKSAPAGHEHVTLVVAGGSARGAMMRWGLLEREQNRLGAWIFHHNLPIGLLVVGIALFIISCVLKQRRAIEQAAGTKAQEAVKHEEDDFDPTGGTLICQCDNPTAERVDDAARGSLLC